MGRPTSEQSLIVNFGVLLCVFGSLHIPCASGARSGVVVCPRLPAHSVREWSSIWCVVVLSGCMYIDSRSWTLTLREGA